MASIQRDTELMTNYIPALPVAPSSKFVTCLDPTSRRAMVFAVSNDPIPKLNVIKEDVDGNPQLIDMGPYLGIPSGSKVIAFDCQQSADLTIYLCVAVAIDSSSSNVLVVKPFQWTSTPSLSVLPSHSVGVVQNIYMGNPDEGHDLYPIILVTSQPKGRITQASDITRILVDPYLSSWAALRDMQLPVNVDKIIDIAPAANAYGRGLYALCAIQGTPKIVGEFARYDTDQNDGSLFWFNLTVQTPPGASSIATFADARGRSSLLVGYDAGLQLLTASQATSKFQIGKRISGDVLFQKATTLKVAQDKDVVTVWSVSGAGQLGYIRSTTATLSKVDPITGTPPKADATKVIPITVLPAGQVSGFSASVSSPLQGPVAQTLVTNDNSGNLTLLQQYTDTGLWRKKPFYYASSAANIEVPSYNISLHALDNLGKPVVSGTINIASSAYVDVIINGKPVTLTAEGSNFDLDGSGEISFIIATDSVASQTFTISKLIDRKGTDLKLSPLSIDASQKVIETFRIITDLNTAKTKTGALLLEGIQGLVADDIRKVGQYFKQLLDVKDSMQDKEARSKLPPVQKAFAEGWHWVKQKVAEAIEWGVKLIDNAWNFVCTIAGQAIQFVLDTAEKIGEAFQWLWQKIKLGINKLIEFAGFLFSWGDIVATKTSIVSLTNAVIDCGIDGMGSVQSKVNTMFDNLRHRLNLPESGPAAEDNTGDKKSDNPIMNSPPVKWITERMKNGGATEGATVRKDQPGTSDPDITSVVENELKTAAKTVVNILTTIGQEITDMFNGSGKTSAGALIDKIKTTALSQSINALQGAVNGFMKVVVKLLQYFRDLGNYVIDMPVFTPLYRKFVGNDPSMLDIVSLIIAVPMTIITKLVTGKAPPTLPSRINPKVVSCMFAYNGQFLTNPNAQTQFKAQAMPNGPSSFAAAEAPPDDSSAASVVAMTKLTSGQDLNPDDKLALGLLAGFIAIDKALDDFIADLKAFVTIVPTIIAGIVASVALIIPVVGVIQAVRAAKKAAVGSGKVDAVMSWLPSKPVRYISLAFPFIGAVFTCIFPHPELPGLVPRLFSAATTMTSCAFGAIYSKLGDTVMTSDHEEMFQFLNAMGKTINFGLYCGVYASEIEATSWVAHDNDCSGLAISGITLQYVSDMAGLVTFNLLRKWNVEAGLIAMGVQWGAGFLSGVMCIARYSLQVDRKYLPTYMKS